MLVTSATRTSAFRAPRSSDRPADFEVADYSAGSGAGCAANGYVFCPAEKYLSSLARVGAEREQTMSSVAAGEAGWYVALEFNGGVAGTGTTDAWLRDDPRWETTLAQDKADSGRCTGSGASSFGSECRYVADGQADATYSAVSVAAVSDNAPFYERKTAYFETAGVTKVRVELTREDGGSTTTRCHSSTSGSCPAVTHVDLDLTNTGLDVPEADRSLQKIFFGQTEYAATAAGADATLQDALRDLGGNMRYQENCNRYGFNVNHNYAGTDRARIGVWFNQETECIHVDTGRYIGKSGANQCAGLSGGVGSSVCVDGNYEYNSGNSGGTNHNDGGTSNSNDYKYWVRLYVWTPARAADVVQGCAACTLYGDAAGGCNDLELRHLFSR